MYILDVLKVHVAGEHLPSRIYAFKISDEAKVKEEEWEKDESAS